MDVEKIYLFTGSEGFLKEERLEAIKKALFGITAAHPDYNIYYAGKDSIITIVDTCRLMPFSGKRRLVIIKETENLKKDECSILLEYVKNPVDSSFLILETSQRNLSKDLEDVVLKYAKRENFEPLKGEGLFRWVKTRFSAQGKSVSHSVTASLINRTGPDLYSLSSAIEKLILYTGKRNSIQQNDVESLVGIDRSTSTFEFVNAVSEEDFSSAIKTAVSLLRDGTTAQEILGLIGWQMNQFAQVLKLLEEGLMPQDIARRLNIPMFRIDTVISRVKNLRLKDIERRLDSILDSDLSIKTGRTKPLIELESLTLRLCFKSGI